MSMVLYNNAKSHCEERFVRRGNLKVVGLLSDQIAGFIRSAKFEIASLRSQRRLKDLFSDIKVTHIDSAAIIV